MNRTFEGLQDPTERLILTALIGAVQSDRAFRQGSDWREPLSNAYKSIGRPAPTTPAGRRARRFVLLTVGAYFVVAASLVVATANEPSVAGSLHPGDVYGWDAIPLPSGIGRHFVGDPTQAAVLDSVIELLRKGLDQAGAPSTVDWIGTTNDVILGAGGPHFWWIPTGDSLSLSSVPSGASIYQVRVPLGHYFATGQADVYVALSSSLNSPVLDYKIDPSIMRQIADLLYPLSGSSS